MQIDMLSEVEMASAIAIIRSLIWAGAMLGVALIIMPVIKFIVRRNAEVREKEIELEREQTALEHDRLTSGQRFKGPHAQRQDPAEPPRS